MKNLNLTEIFDEINVIGGTIMSIPAFIFGEYWILFVGFLILNCMDYHTGVKKATKLKEKSSKKGKEGIAKKVYLWFLVALGFLMSVMFKQLGNAIGMDLGISMVLGYLVLAALIVNEIRSILENLIELDVEVPKILIEGLKVADEKLNIDNKGDDNND